MYAAPVQAAAQHGITLDITRLLSRALHATPTGIDRVEHAYARALLAEPGRAVRFEAWAPGLGFVAYRRASVVRLLDAFERRWSDGAEPRLGDAVRAWSGLLPRRARGADDLHLIVSHQHLADLGRRARKRSKICVYIHDAIPSEYPEYARPGGAATHSKRLRNAVALADGIIVNSQCTADSLEHFFAEAGRRPRLLVAPLGIEPRFAAPPAPAAADTPYFLCVGTIEPRKNHLLLLQLWRTLAARASGEAPRLILAGRRGWENENVVDLLDRSTPLQGVVTEAGRVGDSELAALMAGARAVLMPSFAEGFGLPVAEALAAGVPVIASDIAVLRETGGEVPDYIDPLDGPGWLAAIANYADPRSPMRAAQLKRMRGWQAPRWDAHFERVLPFLDSL
jgi:glycosyltransferase involved in cell wall biosynthesis